MLVAILLLIASCVAVAVNHAADGEFAIARKAMKLLYVDLELNAPAFFSALLLLLASALSGLIFYFKRGNGERLTAPWAVLAAGFAVMTFDELVAAHERLIEPMRELLGDGLGVFYFAWVVPAIGLIFGLGLYFAKFLIKLPPATRAGFIVGAALFLGGAIGVEMLGGRHAEVFGKENLPYVIFTTCEEALEMSGVIVFLRTAAQYFAQICPTLGFSFTARKDNSAVFEQAASGGTRLNFGGQTTPAA